MANDQRVGLRLTGDLRDTLEREADDAGITLSALVRQRVLMTHPHIAGNMATTPWLLATFGDVGNISTSMWEIEKLPLRNDAVFPPLLWTGTWCKTPKPPRFTKSGQEPTPFTLVGN